ncbi:hypothetical protein BBP40_012142 [Aspergillus hancockii]|nr:hypothetical protein BBP40_012142 [Aspergillus hancockii]
MPSYFYHLAIEIFARPPPNSRGTFSGADDQSPTSLSFDSTCEALQPFQKRSRRSTRYQSNRKYSGPSTISSSDACGSNTATPTTHPATPHLYTKSPTSVSDFEKDLRLDKLSIECIDMIPSDQEAIIPKRASRRNDLGDNPVTTGIGTDILGGLRTRGNYIPLDQEISESVWGIVHLYRDAQDTPYLTEEEYPSYLKGSAAARQPYDELGGSNKSRQDVRVEEQTSSLHPDDECTTLCILAVPSYMSPSDFMGFVGEASMDDVSHFRMIRTARANRYMVLMKFRSGKKAKEWQKEWNGKVFNSSAWESDNSSKFALLISFRDEPPACEHTLYRTTQLFGHTFNETSSPSNSGPHRTSNMSRLSRTYGRDHRAAYHNLPTCFSLSSQGAPYEDESAECNVCRSEINLWICLICGIVGCGRYDGAHAFDHYKETSHTFAMDLSTQRVWDYVGDAYVHRIIQSKTDGKLVELPAADNSALDPPDWTDAVPREKLENMSVEYTHLLTSQLESQRAYFEEIVERAVDKASQATAAAVSAQEAAEKATASSHSLHSQYDKLANETLPGLERDKTRAEKRAEKFEVMARKMEKEWREEKTVNESLMKRIEHLTSEVESLKAANTDLSEQNRDLTFFISGSERLKNQSEDIVQGTISVPEPQANKKKGKGKGRR